MNSQSLNDITEIYSDAEKAWLSENYQQVRDHIAGEGKMVFSEISSLVEKLEAYKRKHRYGDYAVLA